jgi:hypothetical protein
MLKETPPSCRWCNGEYGRTRGGTVAEPVLFALPGDIAKRIESSGRYFKFNVERECTGLCRTMHGVGGSSVVSAHMAITQSLQTFSQGAVQREGPGWSCKLLEAMPDFCREQHSLRFEQVAKLANSARNLFDCGAAKAQDETMPCRLAEIVERQRPNPKVLVRSSFGNSHIAGTLF